MYISSCLYAVIEYSTPADPLRVLRAVRFASRFGFNLEESLIAAAQDDEVRGMLGHKVSRERIGAELEGMIGGPDPVAAVHLLQRLRLFEAVFEVHPSATADVTELFASAGSTLVSALYDVLSSLQDIPSLEADARRQILLAALLLPLRAAEVVSAKGKTQTMSSHIVRDSLKWKAKDAEIVDVLHAVAPRLLTVHRDLVQASAPAPERARVQLGRCIRDLGPLWIPATAIAALIPSPEAKILGVEASVADHAALHADGSVNDCNNTLVGR